MSVSTQIEIVLVDDEQLQLDYMEKMIKQAGDRLGIEVEIYQYLSGEAFLFALGEIGRASCRERV